MGLLDSYHRAMGAVFGMRDASPSPTSMVGFPSDGGVIPYGVTATTALGLSSVWRCLDILSNGVAQLDWQERRGNLELPPSRLVTRPQSTRTRREWVSVVVSTLALYDVCYLLKVDADSEGVPLGLWYLDPSIVMPTSYDAVGILPPSEYQVAGVNVSADRLVVLHRSPQPGVFDTSGGVIRLARITFAAAIAAENYASRYWQSGGSPTVILESDGAIPAPLAQSTSDRWGQMRRAGPDHPAVLGSGLKAREFGANPTEAAATEARREQVADIGRYFGVPTRILNAPTGDSETYATSEMANQDLVRYTLRNYIAAIEDAITDQLPGGRRMVMDTTVLTMGTQLATAQALQLATGAKPWMTVDEAREFTGMAPIETPSDLLPEPVMTGGPNV